MLEGSVPQRQKRCRSCSTLGANQFVWQMQLNAVINARLPGLFMAFKPARAMQIQTRHGECRDCSDRRAEAAAAAAAWVKFKLNE